MTMRKSAQGTECPHGSPHLLSKLRPPSDQQLKKGIPSSGLTSAFGESRPGTSGVFSLDVVLKTQQGVGTLVGREGRGKVGDI